MYRGSTPATSYCPFNPGGYCESSELSTQALLMTCKVTRRLNLTDSYSLLSSSKEITEKKLGMKRFERRS